MSARARLEMAIRAYVEGRDRVWAHRRKLGPSHGPSAEVEFGDLPSAPRFGVGVPERLDFRRGPATDRDSPARTSTDV